MTRLYFSVLGAVLLALWAIGLAAHVPDQWMVWAHFVAGSFSFVVAMAPVFTGDHSHGDVAWYAFGIATALLLAFVGDLTMHASTWFSISTFVMVLAYVGVALMFQRRTRLYGYR